MLLHQGKTKFHTDKKQVIRTPACYLGGVTFKSRPGDWLSSLRFFSGSFQSVQLNSLDGSLN
jgi:hypothetical protein